MQSTAWWVEKVGCWAWNALEVETETWEGKSFELGLQHWGGELGENVPDARNGQAVRSGLG